MISSKMRCLTFLFALCLVLSTLACAGLSSTRPARDGDQAAMRAALSEDLRAGRLSRERVADLAGVVAERELEVAKGKDAIQRVQQVLMCARSLEGPLEERASGQDAAAPLAAMALLQIGRGEPGDWRELLGSEDGAWRAVAVRTLTDEDHGGSRRVAMLDPDERVRLAAVRAAEDAVDQGDRSRLYDVARQDPDALVRVTAVRAIGWLPSEDVVLRLRELWATAPEPVHQAIVASWSFPGMLERGGERELFWVAETKSGAPAIIAGGILMRLGGGSKGAGLAALHKGIQEGIPRDRALAIGMAPLNELGFRDLIKKAAQEAEPTVQVAALSRLARDPKERADALKKLGELAVSAGPAAANARDAMATLEDARATRLLLDAGKSQKAVERKNAARGLIALGNLAQAAFFMADADPGVRTQTACAILSASERW